MVEWLTWPGLLVRRDLALSSISLRAGRQQVSARYTTCEGEVSSCSPPAAHLYARHNSKDDEPEPEEDVDLLIDDVKWEDTEPVKLLDSSRRTKLVKSALGHLNVVLLVDVEMKEMGVVCKIRLLPWGRPWRGGRSCTPAPCLSS